MSNRSAKLLMEVADSFHIATNRGGFDKMGGGYVHISYGLAHEVLLWEKGYVDHLQTVQARRAGDRKVELREIQINERHMDEMAISRVLDLVEDAELGKQALEVAGRAEAAGLLPS